MVQGDNPSWPGRPTGHLIHGYKQFNFITKRWDQIAVDPERCAKSAGGFAFHRAKERWQIQHQYSKMYTDNECLESNDSGSSGVHDTFVGSPMFYKMLGGGRWGTKHRYRRSVEFKFGGSQNLPRRDFPVFSHGATPWDFPAGELATECCGVGGTSGIDPDTGQGNPPHNPTEVPPPKLFVRFQGSSSRSYSISVGGVCASVGFTGEVPWEFDFCLELHRINVGCGTCDIDGTSSVAYYVCSPKDTIFTGKWGSSEPPFQPVGGYFVRTININGKTTNAQGDPLVYNCLMPDICGASVGPCSYLWLSMVCEGDVSGPPGSLRNFDCPGAVNKVWLISDGFDLGYPDSGSSISSGGFHTKCQESCSDWDVTLGSKEGIPLTTDANLVGAGGSGDVNYTMKISSKPFYDYPHTFQFDTAGEGYFNADGHVRRSDFEDKTHGEYWRDMTKAPGFVPNPEPDPDP